jgi:hypothetical protein
MSVSNSKRKNATSSDEILEESTVVSHKRKRLSAGVELTEIKQKRDNSREPSTSSVPLDKQLNSDLCSSRTVYIEGLPFDASEDDVRGFFKDESGKQLRIVQLRLVRWHDTGRLRG